MLYLLNRTTEEIHCLDDEKRSREICNVDQIKEKEFISELDALRNVAANPKHACIHCWPKDE